MSSNFYRFKFRNNVAEQVTDIFRPEAGKFPPIEKAHTFQGELTLVDHANRRGDNRVQGPRIYRSSEPHPFAMLPYGMVRYHGAPADLRDIPLGTILHVTAFLPPLFVLVTATIVGSGIHYVWTWGRRALRSRRGAAAAEPR